MSLNVLIGNEDITKIQDTIYLFEFVKQILGDQATFQLPAKTYTLEEVDSLLDWYNSLHHLLITSGNEEDIVLEPSLS